MNVTHSCFFMKHFISATVAILVFAVVAGWFVFHAGNRVDFGKSYQADPVWSENIDTKAWGPVAAGQIMVLVKSDEPNTLKYIANAINGRLVGRVDYLNLYQFAFDRKTEADLGVALANAAKVPGVLEVFPNVAVRLYTEGGSLNACPNVLDDEVYAGSNSGAYDMIGVNRAWHILNALDVDLNDVHIGVLDTAVMTRDPADVLPSEFNNVSLTSSGTTNEYWRTEAGDLDQGGIQHANAVLGLICADNDDGGISGIASVLGRQLEVSHTDIFRQASFPDAREGDPEYARVGSGEGAYVVRTIIDMMEQIENGATIINGSYGSNQVGPANQPIARVYTMFYERMAQEHPDVLFVFAAGNEGGVLDGTNSFPGGMPLPNVITVGNVNNDGNTNSTSNRVGSGGEVTLAAPGEQSVWGRGADGVIINSYGGTSSAAPMVTAAAALVRAANPDLTASEIKDLLVRTSSTGPTNVGGRILQVDAAVLEAANLQRQSQNTFIDFLLDDPTEPLTMEYVDRVCAGEDLDTILRELNDRAEQTQDRVDELANQLNDLFGSDAQTGTPSTTPIPTSSESPYIRTSTPDVASTPAPVSTPAPTYTVWEGINATVGLNVTTTQKYQSQELARSYSGGGVSDSKVLEKTLLKGGFSSSSEAMDWICSSLTNIRYAKFSGMVADYQGRRVLLGNVKCS
jgi:hypothetical protein